jgi:DNA-binding GntR family transcriptional regulator
MTLARSSPPQGGSPFAAQLVHERLRDAILSGELRPNVRLVEEDLAASLEVSRTPVREALLALTQEGLVVRSRGWLVRDHQPEEILRVIEARAVVEGAAAGLAASRIRAADLTRLRELASAMEGGTEDRPALNALNREFHAVITDAAGNALLSQFAQRTAISYWNFTLSLVQPTGDDGIVNEQHREIIARLEAGDSAGSELRVREHVDRTRAVLAEALGIGSAKSPRG